jgi:hypothetical protein
VDAEKGRLPCGQYSAPVVNPKGYLTWDELVLPYGAPTNLLVCASHKQGSRHYWANANVDNRQLRQDNPRQTGVMAWGFSVKPETISRPTDTVAFTEIRDHNATYAQGGMSKPGEFWGSMLLANEDAFILQRGVAGEAREILPGQNPGAAVSTDSGNERSTAHESNYFRNSAAAGFHPHRVAGRDRYHSDPRRNAVAGAQFRQGARPANLMFQQLASSHTRECSLC